MEGVTNGCFSMSNQEETEPRKPEFKPGNPAATTGLVLGIASIFLGGLVGLLPIIAIVFAGIGLSRASARQNAGKIQAWIGLILGIVYTVVYLGNSGRLG